MVKRKLKPFVLPSLYLTLVVLFCLMSYLLTKSFQVAETVLEGNYTYVSYEVLIDNTIPVISEKTNTIIKPYRDMTVTIGKAYYDYTKPDEEKESAIVYFENTYIQNSGVDYVSENVFDVVSVLNGTVFSVTEDDIIGKTVKIRHNDGTISVYQSLSEVLVNEDMAVAQGEIIGKSGTSAINNDLGNHLHFELFYNNQLVDPEKYYGMIAGE